MKLKGDAIFDKKRTGGLKNDKRSSQNSETLHFDGKWKYRNTEEWKMIYGVKNDTRRFSRKIFTKVVERNAR